MIANYVNVKFNRDVPVAVPVLVPLVPLSVPEFDHQIITLNQWYRYFLVLVLVLVGSVFKNNILVADGNSNNTISNIEDSSDVFFYEYS